MSGAPTVDLDEISRLQEGRFVTVRPHPKFDLFIANYTEKAQFEKAWEEHPLLLDCRGLIYNSSGVIKARGFSKFFNLGEVTEIPKGKPVITEKLDGSLGISYPGDDGQFYVATRGSFESPQAEWASHWLNIHGKGFEKLLPQNNPALPLFEIIYPGNRVVVNYGDRAELVLLTLMNRSGRELNLNEIWKMGKKMRWTTVPWMMVEDWQALKDEKRSNFEGYVAWWPDKDFRVKIKLEEYVQLNKMMAGISEKWVWETCRDNVALNGLAEKLPDELFQWALHTKDEMYEEFVGHWNQWCDFILDIGSRDVPRKELASQILAHAKETDGLSAVGFHLLDCKQEEARLDVWRALEPKNSDRQVFTWLNEP